MGSRRFAELISDFVEPTLIGVPERFHPVPDNGQEPVSRCLCPTRDIRRIALLPSVHSELVLVEQLDVAVWPGSPHVEV